MFEQENDKKFPKVSHFYDREASKGLRSAALVELVDIFPTLAEAAGLPPLSLCPVSSFNIRLCTEGASLMPLIKDAANERFKRLGRHDKSNLKPSNMIDVHVFNTKENNRTLSVIEKKHVSSVDQDILLAVKNCSLVSQHDIVRNSFYLPLKNDWKHAAFSQFPRPSVLPEEDSDKPLLADIRIMGYSMMTQDFHYVEWVGFEPDIFKIRWDVLYARELYLRSADPYNVDNVAEYSECQSLVNILSAQLQQGWRSSSKVNHNISL